MPSKIRSGRLKSAIVLVHDITEEELPELPPFELNLWLAGQETAAIALSETAQGFEASVSESDREFLREHPDAIVAARVAPLDKGVMR